MCDFDFERDSVEDTKQWLTVSCEVSTTYGEQHNEIYKTNIMLGKAGAGGNRGNKTIGRTDIIL